MDEQLVRLLANTQLPQEGPRKQAEIDLIRAKTNPDFPLSLARIGSHPQATVEIRQSALTYLRKFVEENWSPEHTDGIPIPIPDPVKDQLRQAVLQLVLNDENERKVKVAASYVVSKIAVVDFPHQWPALLPSVLGVMPAGTDAQLHGALRILQDLVEESLTDEQFFSVARDIIKACHDVALNDNRKQTHRSLAVLVLRSCFDLMDIVKDDHKTEVRAFADEVLRGWLPFFQQVIAADLPERDASPTSMSWYGPIALKIQVVRTLIKIKTIFRSLLVPQSFAFFEATWGALTKLEDAYRELFIDSDSQGRLEDIEGLPYTLDYLVLDLLDFLNQLLRAPPVQQHLQLQITTHGAAHQTPWVLDLMKLLACYSRISHEEEGLWDIDVSLYLAEEASISSNYTARTACGDLMIKVAEWLDVQALEGLFAYTQTLFGPGASDWRRQEAALYLLNTVLVDFQEIDKGTPAEIATAYMELVNYAVSRADEPLLRARGFLAAGAMAPSYKPAGGLLAPTIEHMTSDDSEVVQVACIKALEGYIKAGVAGEYQTRIVQAIQRFLNDKDLTELEDADDLLVALLETLHVTINLDVRIVLQSESSPLDLLFQVAKHGATNYQISSVISDAFEEICETLSEPAAYAALCAKFMPSLTAAFDVASLTGDDPLITMTAELLAILVQHGSEPLPPGFVASVLPKVNKLLMTSTEGEVLRPGAEAVKYMLMHDHHQVFAWHDAENNCSGLEVCLRIIDRLLGPSIEDNAASEVGGVAAELVEKAGQERLGPYLLQLLKAVAERLETAQAAPFIQSLILVFARLSLNGAQDVVTFLSETQISGHSGLQVVITKWLENSVTFSGYDEIRQNVIALSKLYSLNDPRLAQIQVKGELIIPTSNRIMTRSRTKQTPDQYTIIPAPLKILKLLIDELSLASGHGAAASAAAAVATAEFDNADDEDDDGWEDDNDTIDLASASIKADLMGWGVADPSSGGSRQRDDETQTFLVEFFLKAAQENIAGFQDWFGLLTEDEQRKLNELAQQ